MTNRSNDLRVLGCDVGKDSITLFDTLSGQTRCLDNTPKALRRALAEVMPDPAGALLVCEATGGHEAALLAA
ncbi:hypothetical protein M2319_004571, partial [Rhodobium gokarnense]|nr:hypothetical protein [Rhodobium gokarnense]